MDRGNRSGLAVGMLLILLGIFFLALQLLPGLQAWFSAAFAWPLIVIGVGVFLFIFGLLVRAPGMAVPAAIVTGIGGLLYWQNATGNWASWAYAWALIPGFVGIGVILAGLLGENTGRSLRDGLNLLIISLVLFVIFGSFLGGLPLLGPYWPVILILFGLWLLFQAVFRTKLG